MSEFRAGGQVAETVGNSVVGELQFAKARQCGESFECGETGVAQAERFECCELVGKTDDICAAAIVQNQFGDLELCKCRLFNNKENNVYN